MPTARPRLLIVAPTMSHPAYQGNSARIQAFGTEMTFRGLECDYLYYGMDGMTPSQENAMRAFWSSLIFMQSQRLPPMSHSSYWGLDDWCPDALCELVAKLHRERRYQAILVNYVWLSRVLEGVSNTLKVIDTHDLFGDRHQISKAIGLEPRWFFTSVAEEDRGFKRADLVIGIQHQEADIIRSRTSSRVITIGHAIQPSLLLRKARRKSFASFGYLGSGNPWNVKSIRAIDGEICDGEGIDWLIAGSITQTKLLLRSDPYVLGLVDKVDDFYDLVRCVINPMIGGTGLKIKTVEALSFGAAVIGTIDAFVGLPTLHEAHALKTSEEVVMMMRNYLASETLQYDIERKSRMSFLRYAMGTSAQLDEFADLVK